MASKDGKVIGLQELTWYDNLLKQYINKKNKIATNSQIDELFENDEPVNPSTSSIDIKPFDTATDEEFAAIINGYYNGTFSLEDIQEYWNVGDIRKISMSIENDGQLIIEKYIRIIDFLHDNLTSDSDTKALITVELTTVMPDAGVMNTTATNAGGWHSCARRSWCNTNFFNSLPEYIKNLIKTVDKSTSSGGQSSTIVTSVDKIFLLSERELGITQPQGTPGGMAVPIISFSYDGEGYKYNYYSTSGNNIKYGSTYWTRSPSIMNSSSFCYIVSSNYGSAGYGDANQSQGIAPAFCL